MNPAHRLLLTGAETAEKAFGPERGALVYQAIAEQTTGEGRDAALLGFLRCAIASPNRELASVAIAAWQTAVGEHFEGMHAVALELGKHERHAELMSLLRVEVGRSRRPRSLLALGLALAQVERNFELAAKAFHEANDLSRDRRLTEAAQIRALHASVKVPKLRKQALLERKQWDDAAHRETMRSPVYLRLLAEVDLYSPSRFRRAAAIQQLAELAHRGGVEGNESARALVSFLEWQRNALSPLERDRALPFLTARGMTSEQAPPSALVERARAVLRGAPPAPANAHGTMLDLLVEFVAECGLPEGSAAPHTDALLRGMRSDAPLNADYTFRCLAHVWAKPDLAIDALERTARVARLALERPGAPSSGFLALLGHAPESARLDLVYAAAAVGERGTETALISAATTLGRREPPDRAYALLRELRGFLAQAPRTA